MARKINLEMEIDWEDYEDVSDELILDDALENYHPKDGVTIKISSAIAERDKLIDDMLIGFKRVTVDLFCKGCGWERFPENCPEGCGLISDRNLIARAEAMRGRKLWN